eukprot:4372607-Prorocentrum_lima.AAC.1
MTSSLVGSEMCIRDRRIHRQQTAAGIAFNPPSSASPPVPGGPTIAASCKAVSYTHLTLPTICSV